VYLAQYSLPGLRPHQRLHMHQFVCHDHSTDQPIIQPRQTQIEDQTYSVVDKIAKCTKIAVCDNAGKPCTAFEVGQTAIFYFEIEYLQDGDVPLGGVEIFNYMNLAIVSKGSLHYLIDAPKFVRKGDRVRFRQTMEMSVSPGEYTFVVAFGTMSAEVYARLTEIPNREVYYNIQHGFRIRDNAVILIREKSKGLRRPFYGAVDLKGDSMCSLIAGDSSNSSI